MADQLVIPFAVEPNFAAANFIVAPCNEQADAFITRWPDWPVRAAALYGPAGCGKSHLAMVWSRMAGAHILSASASTDASLAFLADHRDDGFVIEDVDREPPTRERDAFLMALFERANGTMLLTGRAAPSAWPVATPDLTSRFQSLIALPMWAPDDVLLRQLVAKHFADRQVKPSESAIERIVSHVERTPAAIAAFVERADLKALAEKRGVTERLVLGLLEAETGSGSD